MEATSSKEQRQAYADGFREKLRNYKDSSRAREWLSRNVARVQAMFENVRLRDFIFEPFKDVFHKPTRTLDAHVYSVITQVAVVNAVLAGLPGRMGVGVYIVMALEGWMAYRIAKHVGVAVNKPGDIWKYFGLLAATTGVILYAFRTLLGLAFSVISIVPGVNPLIFAEFLVTDFVGLLFLVGFTEAKASGAFRIPKRMLMEIATSTKALFTHQLGILKNVLSPNNIKTVAQRVSTYLSGDIPIDVRMVNGEVFATVAMAYLLAGEYEKLDGPIGEAFLHAIRLRWSSQLGSDASVEEIAARFQEYDSQELEGALNTIKGKMFEILVTDRENSDDDPWLASMHTDESFPGSDIVFDNPETGERIEVSLKAVSEDNTQIIEHALARYPDTPIMATDEVARLYEDNNLVFGSGFSHEELQDITEDNLDKLLSSIRKVDEQQVAIGGVVVGTTAALWPFVMAYLKRRITRKQLERVCEHVLGKSAVSLVSRISYAALFGPVFAWYLLARGVIALVPEPISQLYIEFRPRRAQ